MLIVSIVMIALMVLVIFFSILQQNKRLDNKKYNGLRYDKQWLIDNCECFEWDGEKKCTMGFELENGICINKTKNTFTNVLISCSKYKCPEGNIVDLNADN